MKSKLPENWEKNIEGKTIIIATPMIDGVCCSNYLKSVVSSVSLLRDLGVKSNLMTLNGCSVIELARNTMAQGFLDSGADFLMFIDSDMGFDPAYIPLMMYFDKDIITGPSPQKEINWKLIDEAYRNGDEFNLEDLPYIGGKYILQGLDSGTTFNPMDLTELNWCGTGFTLIKREVFEGLKDETKVIYSERGQYNLFFQVDYSDQAFNGEDVYFTKLAKRNGFEIWLCPWMEITHVGKYDYVGDLKSVSKIGRTSS
jgi:glycosyltransferase involved in cell wall biosynthesis